MGMDREGCTSFPEIKCVYLRNWVGWHSKIYIAFQQCLLERVRKLCLNLSAFLSRILKATYFLRKEFLKVEEGYNFIFCLEKLIAISKFAIQWNQIEDRKWDYGQYLGDPWIYYDNTFYLITPIIERLEDFKVISLLNEDQMSWNTNIISELVDSRDVQKIISIPFSLRIQEDIFIWHFNKSVKYSVKSAYIFQ